MPVKGAASDEEGCGRLRILRHQLARNALSEIPDLIPPRTGDAAAIIQREKI